MSEAFDVPARLKGRLGDVETKSTSGSANHSRKRGSVLSRLEGLDPDDLAASPASQQHGSVDEHAQSETNDITHTRIVRLKDSTQDDIDSGRAAPHHLRNVRQSSRGPSPNLLTKPLKTIVASEDGLVTNRHKQKLIQEQQRKAEEERIRQQQEEAIHRQQEQRRQWLQEQKRKTASANDTTLPKRYPRNRAPPGFNRERLAEGWPPPYDNKSTPNMFHPGGDYHDHWYASYERNQYSHRYPYPYADYRYDAYTNRGSVHDEHGPSDISYAPRSPRSVPIDDPPPFRPVHPYQQRSRPHSPFHVRRPPQRQATSSRSESPISQPAQKRSEITAARSPRTTNAISSSRSPRKRKQGRDRDQHQASSQNANTRAEQPKSSQHGSERNSSPDNDRRSLNDNDESGEDVNVDELLQDDSELFDIEALIDDTPSKPVQPQSAAAEPKKTRPVISPIIFDVSKPANKSAQPSDGENDDTQQPATQFATSDSGLSVSDRLQESTNIDTPTGDDRSKLRWAKDHADHAQPKEKINLGLPERGKQPSLIVSMTTSQALNKLSRKVVAKPKRASQMESVKAPAAKKVKQKLTKQTIEKTNQMIMERVTVMSNMAVQDVPAPEGHAASDKPAGLARDYLQRTADTFKTQKQLDPSAAVTQLSTAALSITLDSDDDKSEDGSNDDFDLDSPSSPTEASLPANAPLKGPLQLDSDDDEDARQAGSTPESSKLQVLNDSDLASDVSEFDPGPAGYSTPDNQPHAVGVSVAVQCELIKAPPLPFWSASGRMEAVHPVAKAPKLLNKSTTSTTSASKGNSLKIKSKASRLKAMRLAARSLRKK
eukprot:TRINITY_DN10961_c0_g1_i1.p1 TRINITY_DN10961_c0_g1~~TRINITY_DN10961_c0_g1_i1.p1  ORF type:complete len:827 (+),score=103.28 TRINITY_DN10961_c0_g1_i1:94-2574(+)